MITGNEVVFPNNVVSLFAVKLGTIDADMTVVTRPLHRTDPDQSIGVYAQIWEPDEDSYEMGHIVGGAEPTISRYQIAVQAMIKAGSEEQGLAVHSVLSKRIRTVLYRDTALQVALRSLVVTDGSSTERFMRGIIRTQRYMNDDIQGVFVFVSTLDYSIETEIS